MRHRQLDALNTLASASSPRPVEEHPQLINDLSAHVYWSCSRAQEDIRRIDEMQDRIDG